MKWKFFKKEFYIKAVTKLELLAWDHCMNQKLINGRGCVITKQINLIDNVAGCCCYGLLLVTNENISVTLF